MGLVGDMRAHICREMLPVQAPSPSTQSSSLRVLDPLSIPAGRSQRSQLPCSEVWHAARVVTCLAHASASGSPMIQSRKGCAGLLHGAVSLPVLPGWNIAINTGRCMCAALMQRACGCLGKLWRYCQAWTEVRSCSQDRFACMP